MWLFDVSLPKDAVEDNCHHDKWNYSYVKIATYISACRTMALLSVNIRHEYNFFPPNSICLCSHRSPLFDSMLFRFLYHLHYHGIWALSGVLYMANICPVWFVLSPVLSRKRRIVFAVQCFIVVGFGAFLICTNCSMFILVKARLNKCAVPLVWEVLSLCMPGACVCLLCSPIVLYRNTAIQEFFSKPKYFFWIPLKGPNSSLV